MNGIAPTDVGLEVRIGKLGRENVESKGRRYLIEGRLRVVQVDADGITAFATGTEDPSSRLSARRLVLHVRGTWFTQRPGGSKSSPEDGRL